MKVGDLVHQKNIVEGVIRLHGALGRVGIIIDCHPNGNYSRWQVWWVGQHNDDGSAKVGWWDNHRLEVFNEAR